MKIMSDINMLELNCKKKETLFSNIIIKYSYLDKYLIKLRTKCIPNSDDSYFANNPALVIESDFDDLIKDEILKSIEEVC